MTVIHARHKMPNGRHEEVVGFDEFNGLPFNCALHLEPIHDVDQDGELGETLSVYVSVLMGLKLRGDQLFSSIFFH